MQRPCPEAIPATTYNGEIENDLLVLTAVKIEVASPNHGTPTVFPNIYNDKDKFVFKNRLWIGTITRY